MRCIRCRSHPRRRQAEKRIYQETSQHGIHHHFARVFIERGDDLDPLRAVMDLMKSAPQKIDFMAPSVPPIEHESCDEIGNEAAGQRTHVMRQLKTLTRTIATAPTQASKDHDAHLDGIDQQHAQWPRAHLRQRPSRNRPVPEQNNPQTR